MIAIIDYDAGNTFNVQKALQHIGLDAVLTADRDTILAADGVILPGVGAYASAVYVLRERGLIDVIHEVVERNIPLLGICLGMQLLFDESEEYGPTPGLGIIPGTVKAIPNNLGLRVPHMGWNQNTLCRKDSAFLMYLINIHILCTLITWIPILNILQQLQTMGLRYRALLRRGMSMACSFTLKKADLLDLICYVRLEISY